MGWYDAFKKGDVASVNTAKATSDNGSAIKNLGDAFSNIGKSVIDVEDARDVSKLREKQMQKADSGIELDKYNLTSKQIDDGFKLEDRGQKVYDDAFEKDFMASKSKDEWEQKKTDGKYNASAASLEKEQKYFQEKFNDEAISTNVAGGYKNFKEFSDTNPELIKNADGITLSKIEKWYADKDTTGAALEAQKIALKHQQQLSKQEAKIAKLNAKSGEDNQKLNKDLLDLQNSIAKEYGSYDKATGEYVINKDKKEEAQMSLDFGSELLNSGVKSLSQIRKMTKEKFEKNKQEKESADPLGLGI